MAYKLQELQQAFFQDPRWGGVEELIRSYIDPLLNMRQIDTSKSAEDVKAQVIGRLAAYDQLDQFLNHVKLVNHPKNEISNSSPFR